MEAKCESLSRLWRFPMLYLGSALKSSASRAVAIVAGGLAMAVLFWLYMLAASCGLAGGN